MPYATYRFNKIIAAETIRFIVTVAIVVYKGLKLVVYRMLTLKSVSAFANTDGGSLFYGVNDDGVIVGLENPQADADFISEMIKAKLDPVPEVQLIPIEHEGRTLLEVRVKAGTLTPFIIIKTEHVQLIHESVMKVWNATRYNFFH